MCDEVATGFGRTGKMFACDTGNITPDLMAVGKGITGGYLPLSATLATEEIYNGFLGKFEDMKTFFHGHTYTANPLAAAVASANLDLFRDERTLEKLQPKIEFMAKRLKESPGLNTLAMYGRQVSWSGSNWSKIRRLKGVIRSKNGWGIR